MIFDAGRTLVRAHPSFREVFLRGCRRAGLSHITADLLDAGGVDLGRLWNEHERAWRAAGRPSPHVGDAAAERDFWRGLYEHVLGALGVDGGRRRAARVVHETFLTRGAFHRYPEVDATLDRLEGDGVRLGLISNWGRGLRAILEEQGLAGRFEVTVVSAEEAVAKPDPALFLTALERLGTAPGPGVAYVGDDLHCDVEPSRRLGLTPVLVDRGGHHPDHAGPRVTSLEQVPEVLGLT